MFFCPTEIAILIGFQKGCAATSHIDVYLFIPSFIIKRGPSLIRRSEISQNMICRATSISRAGPEFFRRLSDWTGTAWKVSVRSAPNLCWNKVNEVGKTTKNEQSHVQYCIYQNIDLVFLSNSASIQQFFSGAPSCSYRSLLLEFAKIPLEEFPQWKIIKPLSRKVTY